MKIITKHLAEKLHPTNKLMQNTILNPLDVKQTLHILKKNKKIEIFDATQSSAHKPHAILCVKDHINKTGSNPLVRNHNNFNIKLLDMQNLYQYDQHSIITNCCGETLIHQYKYPSHFLCHLSIMARSIGIKKIKAIKIICIFFII